MEKLGEALALAKSFVDGYIQGNEQAAYLLCAIAVGMVVVYYCFYYVRWHIRSARLARRRAMTHPQREKYLNTLVADGIEDVLCDLEVSGKITHEDARMLRKRLGNVLSNPDLLPRGTRVLKDRIKRTKHEGGVAGPKGRLPKPEDVVVSPQRKFGAGLLAMLR